MLEKRKKFLAFSPPSIDEEEIREVVATLESGWLSIGPRTQAFEEEFARYIGVKYAIGLNSCTAALHLALLAHGIGKGDEIILPSFTFAATANMVVNVGATPVFADIKRNTFTVDPDDIVKHITPRTKAILPVHYGGYAVDLNEIQNIAKAYGLTVIEDAAHAVGAEYLGRKVGSFGNTSCFSFYATKNLATGEGGMLTTNNEVIANFVRENRLHGISQDAWKRYAKGGAWQYEVRYAGWKYNMFDLQAALGIHQLRKLDSFIAVRNKYSAMYNEAFRGHPKIILPQFSTDRHNARHLYPIMLAGIDRDAFIEEMSRYNIGVSVHFIPLHLQTFYKRIYGTRMGDLPVTEGVFANILSLPVSPKMTEADVVYVIEVMKEILNSRK